MKTPASFAGKADVAPPVRTVTVTAASRFTGYASLFGVEDQGRDIVMPGAFRASLSRRPAREVRLLFQHDPAEPIGVWEEIREDARGLYVRGHLIEEVGRAREVRALIQAGALDGLSIGFHARKAIRDARTGQRRLYEIDLLEISIVTFPMLPGARVNAMKARGKRLPFAVKAHGGKRLPFAVKAHGGKRLPFAVKALNGDDCRLP